MSAKWISSVLLVVLAFLIAGCGVQTGDTEGPVSACPYRLPFDPEVGDYITTQGNLSAIADWSHAPGKPSQYAFDFGLPNGTPVLAARGGRVSAVREGSTTCGGLDMAGFANFVIVYHGDGTFAYYGHLQPEIVVGKGDVVRQGQLLGYSGNSGFTDCGVAGNRGYHLHFQLQATGDNFDTSISVTCFEGVEGNIPQQGTILVPGPVIPEISGNVSGQGSTTFPSDPGEEMLIGIWEGVITPAPTSIDPNQPEQVWLEVSRSGVGLIGELAFRYDTSWEYQGHTVLYQTTDPSFWPDSEGWFSFWEEGAEIQSLPTEYLLRPVDHGHLEFALSGTDLAKLGTLTRVDESVAPYPSPGAEMIGEWVGELSAPIEFRGAISNQIRAVIRPTSDAPWLSVDVTIGSGGTATFPNDYLYEDGGGWYYCFASLTPDKSDLEAFCFRSLTDDTLDFNGSGVGWSDHGIVLRRVR